MSGMYGYDPERLATLALRTQASVDELRAITSDEPFAADAVAAAQTVATSLEDALGSSLRAVLTSTALTQWDGHPLLVTAEAGDVPVVTGAVFLSVDEMIAALLAGGRPDDATAAGATALPVDGDFALATAITAAEPLQWFHDVNAGCAAFTGGSYAGGGYVTGPDGRQYPIVVPRVETEDGEVFTADANDVPAGEPSVATLGGTDAGWEVIGCQTGVERFQEAPGLDEVVLGALGGTTGNVAALPPNGALDHVVVPAAGLPWLAGATVVPGPVVAPPGTGRADPTDSSTFAVSGAVAGLGVAAAQGVVMATGIDNQTERAYRVTFEEHDDGRTRARIETFRVMVVAGEVAIVPEHVYVDDEGRLTAQLVSYGSPYATDAGGAALTGPVDDVAAVATSGSEPYSYPIPSAVFP